MTALVIPLAEARARRKRPIGPPCDRGHLDSWPALIEAELIAASDREHLMVIVIDEEESLL